MKFTPKKITSLEPNEIFVFGSNLRGIHRSGAAKMALERFGAVHGQGVGLQGNSYAIPTMQGGVETIKPYVDEFIAFASRHHELIFYVTKIGCGIAGFKEEEIAPLFADAVTVSNIILPQSFYEIIVRPKAENNRIECDDTIAELWRKTIEAEMKDWATKFYEYAINNPKCLGLGMGRMTPDEVKIAWPAFFHNYQFSSCPNLLAAFDMEFAEKFPPSLKLAIKFASQGLKFDWCQNYGEYLVVKEIQRILEKQFNTPEVQWYLLQHPECRENPDCVLEWGCIPAR